MSGRRTRSTRARQGAAQPPLALAGGGAAAAAAAAAAVAEAAGGAAAAAAGNAAAAPAQLDMGQLAAMLGQVVGTAIQGVNQQIGQLNEQVIGLAAAQQQSALIRRLEVPGDARLTAILQDLGERAQQEGLQQVMQWLELARGSIDALGAWALDEDGPALRAMLAKARDDPAQANSLESLAFSVGAQRTRLAAVQQAHAPAPMQRAASGSRATGAKRAPPRVIHGDCFDCGHPGHWAGMGQCPPNE